MTVTKSNVSLLRKYIFECAVIALTFAVVFLFREVSGLNVYIRETLTKELSESRKVIEQNNFLTQNKTP